MKQFAALVAAGVLATVFLLALLCLAWWDAVSLPAKRAGAPVNAEQMDSWSGTINQSTMSATSPAAAPANAPPPEPTKDNTVEAAALTYAFNENSYRAEQYRGAKGWVRGKVHGVETRRTGALLDHFGGRVSVLVVLEGDSLMNQVEIEFDEDGARSEHLDELIAGEEVLAYGYLVGKEIFRVRFLGSHLRRKGAVAKQPSSVIP